jgi:hypothetical protein
MYLTARCFATYILHDLPDLPHPKLLLFNTWSCWQQI